MNSEQPIDHLQLLEAIPNPVLAVDREHRITHINGAGARLLNLPQTECVGRKCYELLKTTHCRTQDCACSRAMHENRPVTAETTAQPNGSPLPIRYTAAPLTNEAGEVVGAVEYVLDISRELQERVELNRSLQALRGVPVPVVSMTRDFTVLAINPTACHLLGQAMEACIGRKCYDLFKTEHCHTDRCACQQAMSNGVTVTEETVAHPGGRRLPIRYTGAPLRDHQGRIDGVVEFVLDITQEMEKRAHNREVTEVLFRMKSSDLAGRVAGKYTDELDQVSQAINQGLDAINEVLQDAVNSVQQVTATAAEVSTASQKLAEGAQEQAAAIEEISANLQQTDAQIKTNAENAAIANQLVMATSATATGGRAEMDRMLAAMRDISDAAGSISRIMKVIDEIAFQTNILALNAAVEAARAGKYGRGFAVVAQEVRNLAGRSAKAAQETAQLIETSNKKVGHGVAIAEKTASALDQIVLDVTKVRDLVGEIAVASREQAASVTQVSAGMNQISLAVTGVSAQSEETAAASEELSSIAGGLKSQMAAFKLTERRVQNPEPRLALPPGITPQMLRQLVALLEAQGAMSVLTRQAGPGPAGTAAVKEVTPEQILPLDTDSRGYGGF